MLVIDIDTGDYEIDDRAAVASERLRLRRPVAGIFVIRIGYKATCHIPGRWTPEQEC